MGRGHTYTVLQRGCTDGQQTHEIMLSITNHQRSANENHNEIPPHTSQNGYYQINKHVLARMCRKWCTIGGKADWCSPCGKQHGGSSKN